MGKSDDNLIVTVNPFGPTVVEVGDGYITIDLGDRAWDELMSAKTRLLVWLATQEQPVRVDSVDALGIGLDRRTLLRALKRLAVDGVVVYTAPRGKAPMVTVHPDYRFTLPDQSC